MKFQKIKINEYPFVPYRNHGIYTDFDNWHDFINDNHLYSYYQGLPAYSTLKRFFETFGDHGRTYRNNENRPPNFDHGYMYKKKDRTPLLVYQPYGATEDIDLYRKGIEAWAESRGFQAKVFGFDYGWYNSSCYLVVMGLDLSDLVVKKATKVG